MEKRPFFLVKEILIQLKEFNLKKKFYKTRFESQEFLEEPTK